MTPSLAAMLEEWVLIKQAQKIPDFLDQNRPKKVKEIYSALKRDHPDMSAEMKARIAGRQGKPGKQKQGPPYSGPLTKKGAWKPPSKDELKTLGKDVGAWGLGLGVGTGAGYAIRKKLLPKALPHLGPKVTTGLLLGGSALTGLLGAEAYRRHQKRMDDSR